MAAKTERRKLTPDEIRAALLEYGLREEVEPIPGYAFTLMKDPRHAVDFYAETHGGARAHRFYVRSHSFVLAE